MYCTAVGTGGNGPQWEFDIAADGIPGLTDNKLSVRILVALVIMDAMSTEATEYVRRETGGSWRLVGTRVSLDSVVHAYWQGDPLEVIATNFPSLTPEQVCGAIAFYLRRRDEIDHYLAEQDARWEQVRQASEARNGPLLQRLRDMRQQAAGRGRTAGS